MSDGSSVTQQGLVQQGYTECSPERLRELTWALRFTPGLCMLGALVGLALQNPWIHFTLAVLGISALLLPAHQPFDLLYNYLVRPLVNGPRLPPNPLPRRTACFLGGLMNLGVGVAFMQGAPTIAYVVGGMLIVLQIIVITSHFCVASWMIEIGVRLLGRADSRIDADKARELVAAGAVLVDVRSPAEFARGHLPEAINAPVEEVGQHAASLREAGKPLVLYCHSGMRSAKARKQLAKAGLQQLHDLGGMRRWDS